MSTPALPTDTFGVNAKSVFDLPETAWGPHLDTIASHGIAVVRADLDWAAWQPQVTTNPPIYGKYDDWVLALAQRGIRWQPMLGYDTPWAETVPGQQYSAPNPQAYASFVASVAQRYGRGGSFWTAHPEVTPLPVTTYELWNEPNTAHYWYPSCNPGAYGQVFGAAQSALKQVDPQAVAVVGGLTSAPDGSGDCSPPTFMKDLATVDPTVAATITAVGVHPYDTYYAGLDSNGQPIRGTGSEGQIGRLRTQLNMSGMSSAQLYVTEIGWTQQGGSSSIPDDAASPPNRTDAFTQIANRWPVSNCNVRQVMLWTWLSGESNQTDPNYWWGIAGPETDANGDPVLDDSANAYTGRAQYFEGMIPNDPPNLASVTVC